MSLQRESQASARLAQAGPGSLAKAAGEARRQYAHKLAGRRRSGGGGGNLSLTWSPTGVPRAKDANGCPRERRRSWTDR